MPELIFPLLVLFGAWLLFSPIVAMVLAHRARREAGESRAALRRVERRIEEIERSVAERGPSPEGEAAARATRNEPEPPRAAAEPGPPQPPRRPVAEGAPGESGRSGGAGSASTGAPAPDPAASDAEGDAPRAAQPQTSAAREADPSAEEALDGAAFLDAKAAEGGSGAGEPAEGEPGKAGGLDLERLLGARAPVWIGAVALALAGAFFVKYSFERDLISPGVRIGLGLGFGLGLLGAAEWLRSRAQRIAEGLAAAGVADLLACLYAATAWYGLLGPVAGFLVMAAVTALGVGLSLRHGWMVATIGLVGGLLTPAVVDPARLEAPGVFGYLLLLQGGILAIGRVRAWPVLDGLALLGGLLWAAVWLGGIVAADWPVVSARWIGGFLVASAAIFAARGLADGESPKRRGLAGAAPVACLVLMLGVVHVGGFSALECFFFGLLGAGCLALGRLRSAYEAVAWVAVGTTALMLASWHLRVPGDDVLPWAVLGYGGLFALGGYGCLWGSAQRHRWAALSAGSALAFFLLGYWAEALPSHLPWWAVALAVAGLEAAAAASIRVLRRYPPEGDRALAAYAVGASAAAALAIALGLERHWIAVAWALEVPAVIAIGRALGVPGLKRVAAALAVLVAARLLANPAVLSYPIGDLPVLNWLLWGYGAPVGALGAAAWLLRRDGSRRLAPWLEAEAALLGFAMVTLMVRHGFHGTLTPAAMGPFEAATYAVAWLAAAAALAGAARALPEPVATWGPRIALGLGLLAAILGVGVVAAPLAELARFGSWPVANGLLFLYGAPLGLAALVGALARDARVAAWAWIGALLLFFWLTGTEVRHALGGAGETGVGLVEAATYAVVWLAAGWLAALAARYLPWPLERVAPAALSLFGAGAAALGPLLLSNPLWRHAPVGSWPVLNWLLYAYGAPALLALACAASRALEPRFRTACGAIGLLLLFALVSLEVRHAFQGPYLDGPAPGHAEWYAYSAAWIAFAGALLVAGLLARGAAATGLRWASLVIVFLSVGKVFVLDMAHLEDLLRVLSFLGLGASLMVLAWVYQRFVFGGTMRRGG